MLNVLIDNSPSQMGQQVVTLYNYTGIALSPSDVAFFHFFPIALEKQHTLAHAGAPHPSLHHYRPRLRKLRELSSQHYCEYCQIQNRAQCGEGSVGKRLGAPLWTIRSNGIVLLLHRWNQGIQPIKVFSLLFFQSSSFWFAALLWVVWRFVWLPSCPQPMGKLLTLINQYVLENLCGIVIGFARKCFTVTFPSETSYDVPHICQKALAEQL